MTTSDQTSGRRRYPGRFYVWLGLAIALLGPTLYAGQIQGQKMLSTPWYLPILGTVALGYLLLALVRARSVWRIIDVVWIGLLAAGEWFFLLSLSVLPDYSGPVEINRPFPAFRTTLADGTSFNHDSLRGDRDTVMVFFRGRW